jgi:hypothetical protein
MQIIRETMLISCKLQGIVRRGQAHPKFGGGNSGFDVATNMRRDGWIWQVTHRDFVPHTGLRRAEIVMLNAFRRLLSDIAALSQDLTKWSGSNSMPQLQPPARINVFHNRAATGPPMGLSDLTDKPPVPQNDLYTSPSMNGVRGVPVLHRGGLPDKSRALCGFDDGRLLPGLPMVQLGSPTSNHLSPGPHHRHNRSAEATSHGAADVSSDVIPFGVNVAQLNKEIRHIYGFVVIETAHRVGDVAISEAGGMQKIIESASSTMPTGFHAPYAVGPRPVTGDARVLCAQRLHENLQMLLQGTRRVLEDKAFIALTRGVWDHLGSRAYDCLQNLANGRENPVCHANNVSRCLFLVCHFTRIVCKWQTVRYTFMPSEGE